MAIDLTPETSFLPSPQLVPREGDLYGIDAALTEEERAIRDSVRRFVDDRILPIIGDCYVNGRFPKELIPEMAELGVFGANLPEEYGCAGLSSVAYGLIMQELERNPGGMITRARRQADGSWVLNGAKMWITNGSTAQVAIIWAKTEDGDDSGKSVRGFVVPTDAPGFTAKDQKGKLSLKASDTSELVLVDVHVPADAILPNVQGLKGPLSCLTQARYGISWGAIGAAMACFEEATAYAKTRIMFDKPIGAFQIQQVRLADMLTEIVKGQLLSLHLGRMKDLGTFSPVQVSLAKRNNVSVATDIAREARRLLGGNGILAEYHSMRHMANLESVYTYEGTHDVHSLILGQAVTGLAAFKYATLG
ncbi:MAG: acyl-CoA dehydrogenase family protein [Gemmatimonadaceae bacterium]|nr:acyl-CoA dehydrogenase family protein [Gemmatimonadaceae bacterium]